MALDRPDDDFEAGDARLGQHLRKCAAGGDVPAVRSEPAEPRTREEYYEALRAADDNSADERSADDSLVADPRTDHDGWDTVDAANRPPVDAIRVSPERTTHILDGEPGGGGHRHGIGKSGKTEFPASWDDKKIMGNVLDIARRPDSTPVHQDWNDRWICTGTRDSVEVSVIVLRSGEVWTAWPEDGSPGVVRNPKKGNHDGN
jgi:Bacterial EndoU nuclease